MLRPIRCHDSLGSRHGRAAWRLALKTLPRVLQFAADLRNPAGRDAKLARGPFGRLASCQHLGDLPSSRGELAKPVAEVDSRRRRLGGPGSAVLDQDLPPSILLDVVVIQPDTAYRRPRLSGPRSQQYSENCHLGASSVSRVGMRRFWKCCRRSRSRPGSRFATWTVRPGMKQSRRRPPRVVGLVGPACGAGTGHDLVAVAEGNFAIGPNVNQHGQPGVLTYPAGKDIGRRVRAGMPADQRRTVNVGLWVDRQAAFR